MLAATMPFGHTNAETLPFAALGGVGIVSMVWYLLSM